MGGEFAGAPELTRVQRDSMDNSQFVGQNVQYVLTPPNLSTCFCDPSIPPDEFLDPFTPKLETELKMSSRAIPARGPKS